MLVVRVYGHGKSLCYMLMLSIDSDHLYAVILPIPLRIAYELFSLQGIETVDSNHFITPENIERLKQAKEANRVQVCLFL